MAPANHGEKLSKCYGLTLQLTGTSVQEMFIVVLIVAIFAVVK